MRLPTPLAPLGLALLACGTPADQAPAPPPPAAVEPAQPPPPPPPAFVARQIGSAEEWRRVRDSLGPAGVREVFRLNRIDVAHVQAGDSIVLHAPGRDPAAYVPFPSELPAAAADSTFLVVDQRVQAWAAYERGSLVRWGPTSTGTRATPTPNGLHHVTWKSKLRRSTEDSTWILPFAINIHNLRGISLHQYALPGYPASHACARLLMDDAEWLYGWVETWALTRDGNEVARTGTPVLMMGEYAWDLPGPWRRVTEAPDAATVTLAELEAALTDRRTDRQASR